MRVKRGVFIGGLLGAVLLTSPALALVYTNGSGKGDATGPGANGEWMELTSGAQSFTTGDGATAISTMTITGMANVTGAGINATDDIRVTIPTALGLDMLWDVSDTAAVIGGTASGKVSGTVSYEDSDRTLVLNVTSDFVNGEYVTVSGLAFKTFAGAGIDLLDLEIDNAGTTITSDVNQKTIYLSAVAVAFTNGSGKGDATGPGANGEWMELTSGAQSFTTGDGATAISTMTITGMANVTGAGINATDDIRVTIPTALGLDMLWDVSDTAAVIGGTASGKVSGTVSYEDSDRTLVLNVTSDFVNGEYVTVSGLAFKTFAGAGIDLLDLEIDNAGTTIASDVNQKTIYLSSAAVAFTNGSGKGDAESNLYAQTIQVPAIFFGMSF